MDGPTPVFFCNALLDEVPEPEPGHFLGSCFLCDNPLPCNLDIFMYRGDTPFCSEECRQEQIDIDEAMQNQNQKQRKLSASGKKRLSSSITETEQHTKTHDVHVSAAGTAVAG